jgi:uncharacterized protein (TIRG00374 family)
MNTYNKLLLIIVCTISLYAAFLIFSDLKQIYEKIYSLKSVYYLPILVIAPLSWFVLFLRWHLLLKNLGINIPKKDSFKINLAGYALSITPGKVGELFKAHFVKTKFGISQKNVMSVVVAEQFYTLMGLTIVGSIGILYFKFAPYVMIASASFLVFIIIALSSSLVFKKSSNLISKIPILSKYSSQFPDSQVVIKSCFKKPIFVHATALSVIFWILESLIVYLVLLSFDLSTIQFFNLTSMYATSIIFGVISFLPLGIGVVEGSLAGFLTLQGVNVTTSLIVVIMIRIFTRWYGVSIGLFALKLVGGFSLNNNTAND